MFEFKKASSRTPGMFAYKCATPSKQYADTLVASYLASLHMKYGFSVDFFREGCSVVVQTPDKNLTELVAKNLNSSIQSLSH